MAFRREHRGLPSAAARRHWRAVGVLAVTVGLLAAGLGAASAAQLGVAAGLISVRTAEHPCPAQGLTVRPAGTSATSTVTVSAPSDWPAACAGRPLQIAVVAGGVARTGSATSPAAGADVDVALSGSVTPTTPGVTAAAVVDGWAVAASWSASTTPPVTGPITPGNANTSLTVLRWTSSSPNVVCADVRVSSTVPGQLWALDINTWFAPWNGQLTGYNTNGDVGGSLVPPDASGVGHVYEAEWSYPRGGERQFQVCNSTMPTPAPSGVITNVGASTTMTLGSWTRSTTTGALCVPVTLASVSGNRTWVVDVDVTAAPFGQAAPTFGGTHGAYVRTAASPDRPGWLRLTGAPPYDVVHQIQQPQVTFTICTG